MLSKLVIGSRKSSLAKLQSYLVKKKIQEHFPNLEIEFYFKESSGDIDLTSPLWKMSGKGVFTKDFREDLISEKVDLVIHSWKDLDLSQEEGTEIISVLERADARDMLLFKKSFLEEPKKKIQIYSSSPRREFNLVPFFKKAFPSSLQNLPIEFLPVRGNMQTRISKWKESNEVQGLILAKAAIDRLLSEDFIESKTEEYSSIRNFLREVLNSSLFMILPLSENPNAPAQGALACEIKSSRKEIFEIIKNLEIETVKKSVLEEREILKSFGGGCHQKIGVATFQTEHGKFRITKGKTDSGIILNEKKFSQTNEKQPKAISFTKMFPNDNSKFEFKRIKLNEKINSSRQIYFFSRFEAWNEKLNLDDKIIWTSGLKTWFKLAEKNIWVNGSNDSLGEKISLGLEQICPNSKTIKLTHKDSDKTNSDFEKVFTYEIEPNLNGLNLNEFTHFYWMSGSQFDFAVSKFPEIKSKFHATGHGITLEHLKSSLGHSNIDIFISVEDWKNYHLG